jgi:predicted AlkP superfamily pyrophosphatase or phosphodiesterase
VETHRRKDEGTERKFRPVAQSPGRPVSLSLRFFVSLFFIICLFAAPTSLAVQQSPAKQDVEARKPPISSHIILIVIDGLWSDFVAGTESQRMNIPTIQALRSRGAYAVGIEGVFPTQTLPAHASIMTGSPPADHGLTSDYLFNQESASVATEPRASASEIKIETIFDLARRAKLVTAAVGFPITAGATITFNQPEAADDFVKAAAAAEIIEKNCPNLLMINFTSFNDAQRRHGLLSAESLKALEMIDAHVKKLIDAAEKFRMVEDTTFIMVSDSGASKVEKEFNPNVLLAKKGWLASDHQGRVTSWRAVAQSFGGSAAVFVKDPKDEGFIHEVETFFTQQAEKPDSPIWRIITRSEVTKLGGDPRVALYIDAAPLYAISSRMTGSPITNLSKGADRATSGYAPSRVEMRALFVIAGKGVKSGAQTPYARLIDIAPTMAKLLGLEMKTARGRVISEVLK